MLCLASVLQVLSTPLTAIYNLAMVHRSPKLTLLSGILLTAQQGLLNLLDRLEDWSQVDRWQEHADF